MDTIKKQLAENRESYRCKPKKLKSYEAIAFLAAVFVASFLTDEILPNSWPFWINGHNLLIFVIRIAIIFIAIFFSGKVVDYFYFRNKK